MSGATLKITSPSSDIFSEMFTMEVYEIYWQWLVDPAATLLEELFWRWKNGLNNFIPTWFQEHCFWDWFRSIFGFTPWDILRDGPNWWWRFWIGWIPECFHLQETLRWKFFAAFLLIIGWLAFIILHIIRFIGVLIFYIIHWILHTFEDIIRFLVEIWITIMLFFWWLSVQIFIIIRIILVFILEIVLIIWRFMI